MNQLKYCITIFPLTFIVSISTCFANVTANNESQFVSLLGERYYLYSAPLIREFKNRTALEYYSKELWDNEDEHTKLFTETLWKDSQNEKESFGDFCFSRLWGYTRKVLWVVYYVYLSLIIENGSRIAPEVFNPVRVWTNPLLVKPTIFSPDKPPTVIFVNLVASDRHNPFWFLKPHYLSRLGGGVETRITSIPTHIRPVSDEFIPPTPQHRNGPPEGVYNVLSFPVVSGGEYHIELKILKGSLWTKRLRIMPASLHDIVISLQKNKPTVRSATQFNEMRVVKNGSLTLKKDSQSKADIVESTTKVVSEEPSRMPFSNTNNVANLSFSTVLESDALNREIMLFQKASHLHHHKNYIKRERIEASLRLIQETIRVIPVDRFMYRLIAKGSLGNMFSIDMATGSRTNTSDTDSITSLPMYTLLEHAQRNHDWAAFETLELVRARAVYHELQFMDAKRKETLFVLFEPFMDDIMKSALEDFDYRVLRILHHLAEKRIWRGFLMAVESYTSRVEENEYNDICSFMEITLRNGTTVDLQLKDIVVPMSLKKRLQEVQDEHRVISELWRATKSKERNSTIMSRYNSWIGMFCKESHAEMESDEWLNGTRGIADPAGVIAKLLLPLFPTTRNLMFHGILLRELVKAHPSAERLNQDMRIHPHSMYKDENGIPLVLSPSVFQNKTLFLQWISDWHRSFTRFLSQTLFHTSGDNHQRLAKPMTSYNLSACIPNVAEYLFLHKQAYVVKEEFLEVSEKHTEIHRVSSRTPRKRRRVRLTVTRRVVDSHMASELNTESIYSLKDIVNKWKSQRSGSAEDLVSLDSENLEIYVSSASIQHVSSVTTLSSILRDTRVKLQYRGKGSGICLTVIDISGFPQHLINFYELVHLQKVRERQHRYTDLIAWHLPHLVDNYTHSIINRMTRYYSSPLLSDKSSSIVWQKCVSPQFHFTRSESPPQNVYRFVRNGDIEGIPVEIRIRLDILLYYTHLLGRVAERVQKVIPEIQVNGIRAYYGSVQNEQTTRREHCMILHTKQINDQDVVDVASHEEDVSRISIGFTSKEAENNTIGSENDPLWDVVQLPMNHIHPLAPPLTFMINKKDPHSYFFKGRNKQYEPETLPTIPSIAQAHGILHGHHFSMYIF